MARGPQELEKCGEMIQMNKLEKLTGKIQL
jgi:hypothetical protein